MDDTQRELERIEQELLLTEEAYDQDAEEDIIQVLLAEQDGPAFDDPEKIHDPEEPMVYRNFSNDYGNEPKDQEEKPRKSGKSKKRHRDRVLAGLMVTASVLCLGILGILVYWLEAFLK